MDWVGVDGDEVVTWDSSLNRRSVWTVEGEFVSSSPLPSGAPLVRPAEFPDGSAVVSVALDQPASAGLPYHHFDEQGEWVRSFGTEVVVREPRDRQALSRLVAPAGEASFWASPRFESALEHYTTEGKHLATITRSADWFPGPSEPVRVTPEVPPNPNVRSLRVDEEGLVWVLLTVPNPRWHEGFEETAGDPGFRLADYHQVFDSVVEVLDPETGTLVASRRFDAYFMRFAGPGHVASFDVDEFDVPVIEILEIELARP